MASLGFKLQKFLCYSLKMAADRRNV